ncbi:MAG: hypothetical protein IBX70_07555 [Clostridia bacterium]|nr:hypothetical protein [Clostridia bacterium]
MLYILASDYNKKLHHHIASNGVHVQYIRTLEQLILNDNDTVIIDMSCHEYELTTLLADKIFRCICMGDNNQTNGNPIYISKYQPIEAICSAIFDRDHLVVTIIGEAVLFEQIMNTYPNCNFIDFSYNPNCDLSLIQILDKNETDLLKFYGSAKKKILYPITTIMDLLDPPIKFIKPMMDTLKKSRDTIVRIDKLKGPLDLMLLNFSDLIICVHEKTDNDHIRFDTSIKKIIGNKKMISLNVSTKAYEQFNLSDHMIWTKEA